MTTSCAPERVRNSYDRFYDGKTVLVTGHTGFKGSWLSAWLVELGAKVVGYSIDPPSTPSHFDVCLMRERVTHVHADVRDYERLVAVMKEHRPQVVFHLAAQSLVRPAFEDPRTTFEVNVMGTVNVLEAARRFDEVQAALIVTSDKCYMNVGWEWAYRENDRIGGHEAYSASKACAEIAASVYEDFAFQRLATPSSRLPIATARAGNAVGGGDWARDRIIPDLVRAIDGHTELTIRHPEATRPWQHALEALSGYLWLARLLAHEPDLYRGPWNFGPRGEPMRSVSEVISQIVDLWPAPELVVNVQPGDAGAEKLILGVDCSRARLRLGWEACWSLEQTLAATANWYRQYLAGDNPYELTRQQIAQYSQDAYERRLPWARSDLGWHSRGGRGTKLTQSSRDFTRTRSAVHSAGRNNE